MTDLRNRIIGDYQLEAFLGSTETGDVYRARQLAGDQLIAVKIVRAALAQDSAFRAAFRQQGAALRALRHPHIVEVAGAGVQDGLCYLAIEWLPDGTLRDLLKQRSNSARPWSLALAIELVREAAEALDYAHEQGFVHGSLEPADLLLARSNAASSGFAYTVKVADLGLGWLSIHSEMTADVWADSLIYAMAPERCQGLDIDGRADMYALGVILYEIATGSPPFEATTLDMAVYRHVYTPPTPPRQLVPDLPAALETIILRCLEKAPADRFARASELAEALGEVLRELAAAGKAKADAAQAARDPRPATASAPEKSLAPASVNGISVVEAHRSNGTNGHAPVSPPVDVALLPPLIYPNETLDPESPFEYIPTTLPIVEPQAPEEAVEQPGTDRHNVQNVSSNGVHVDDIEPMPAPIAAYAPEDLIGRSIGDFQLEAYLGDSETGNVYRARQLADDQLAALKVVHTALAQDPTFWKGFHQQAANMRALRHPHIVEVAAVGVQDGLCYQATEWRPEGTLRNLLQRRSNPDGLWSLALAVELVRQVAEALDYAHARGFVHGSIKPNNLLLIQENNGQAGVSYNVKIADFGLAWLAIHSETANTEVWPDTLAYAMAPERCQGLEIDGRADQYALGVILYEIATGSPPFETKTLDAAVYRHVYTQPTPPRRLVPDLPAALETIILRCLAKAPADRFARAADLADALQALLSSPALAPRPRLVTKSAALFVARQLPSGPVIPHVNAVDQYGRTLSARPLTGDGLTIGRAADNDLVLDAPAIEARHLLLDWDGQSALVTNLSGSNNVMIGDDALLAHATQTWEWDVPIRLGPFWLRLEALKPEQAAPGAAETATTLPAPSVADGATQALATSVEPAIASAPLDAPPAEVLTDRIGIMLDQQALTLTPGRAATFRMTLANLGAVVDHLTVTVENVPAGWVAGPPPVLQLNPGGQGLVTLNVTVPQLPESRAGDYPVTLRVRSREKPADSNIAPALWTVLPFTNSTFDLRPKRLRRRLRATYRLSVRNLGNAPARYHLSAADDEEALRYQFAEEQIALEPGSTSKLNLVVRPTRVIWFGRSVQHRFTVQVKPAGDDEIQTAGAQLEQSALITRFMIVMAVLLLLAGLVALWFWYRPNIATLTIDPPQPVIGQPFVVSWQVTNAPTVELRVNGTAVAVPANASRQIFSGFASPPDIRLVAHNRVYGQDSENLVVSMVSPTPTNTLVPTLRPTATPTPTPVPPTPTNTPERSPTPVPPTNTPAPTNTPTSQTLCITGDFASIRGEGPPLTPFLVYFDGRAVGGGTTDRNGRFSVKLGQLNESPGNHSVIVRNRNTNEILRALTCIVPF